MGISANPALISQIIKNSKWLVWLIFAMVNIKGQRVVVGFFLSCYNFNKVKYTSLAVNKKRNK
jgi:hypothetical protein